MKNKKSDVWNYFNKKIGGNEAICQLNHPKDSSRKCLAVITCAGATTSSMRNHLNGLHPGVLKQTEKPYSNFPSSSKSNVNLSGSGSSQMKTSQKSMLDFISTSEDLSFEGTVTRSVCLIN